MKPPAFLLGATLLFWGWQTGFVIAGAVMALVLESPRWLKVRWEFSDEDFTRIWTFCTLLALTAVIFAFTANEGPAHFRDFFQSPSISTQRGAGTASSQAAAAWIRWLPMTLFMFVAAQAFSSREGVPVETLSLILRWRWKRARKRGWVLPAGRTISVSYPYLVVCLFAASMRPAGSRAFFWGFCALLAWTLWAHRSRRFSPATWTVAVGVAITLGFFSHRGIGQLQRLIENYNPQWFTRPVGGNADPLRSKTALGHVGRLKGSGKIVIRLESPPDCRPPALLREASYRTFKGQSWYSDTSERDFIEVRETNNSAYMLVPGKTNTVGVNIACYLRGGSALLPLPPGTARLENLPNLTSLQRNNLGAVLAQGPGLVIFDALYGPGPTIDFPPNPGEDLAVPPKEAPALDQIIAELHLNGQTLHQKLRAISDFFQNRFAYSTWQGYQRLANTNETLLSHFLLLDRRGHCEHFATATVLLLRQLKIPARYAVGYAVHEAAGRKCIVRQRDAHAWCLLWNRSSGTWQEFDTTPPGWAKEEAKLDSPLRFLWDAWSRVVFEFSKFRWGQTRLRQYFLLALIPALVVLLYQIVFRSQRRRHRGKAERHDRPATWPGLDSEFYHLQKRLEERGAVRSTGEPLSDWLYRLLEDPTLADLKTTLQHLLRLHYRYRFDPHGLDVPDREALRSETTSCLATLRHRG